MESTIAGIVAARAAQHPGRVAIRAPGRADLSYGGLQAAIAHTVATLREHRVGAADRVAVVLPNGPEMAVAFLALAGAATCAPLNPALTENELAFAFSDLGVKAVITQGERVPAAVAAAARLSLARLELVAQVGAPAGVFELGGNSPLCDGAAPLFPSPAGEADGAVLLLHTSGTTARPKIVPLTQRNLCVSAANIGRSLALGEDDSCLNLMPLFHIHGLMAALLASIKAGASVICTAGFSAAHFTAWLRDFAPTWYTAVPTMHQAVLEACPGHAPIEGCRLRLIRSASAPLPPHLLRELSARFDVPVIEAYGMTEASHQIASNPLPAGTQKPGSVGLPAGLEIAVMDENGMWLGSGAVGELAIRGATVTSGYEGNPEANAMAFAGGWLRTGDQGYVDGDGYVFLTGRIKELINRGGEKIAPREVEEALLRHPAVAQAVAFAVPHPRLGEEVGAAVVLRAGVGASGGDLRRAAAEHLAYFKVPRRIEIVAAIPKCATGKVRRNGLAKIMQLRGGGTAESEPPRTALERSMAAEWSRLLGVESVGIDDDFFALGGDSLAAMELIGAMRDVLQMDVPIADFLERPTIAAVIDLSQRAYRGEVDGVVPIRSGGDEAPIFCTAAHDGSLWRVSLLVRHLAPGRPIFGFPPPTIGATGPLPTIETLAEQNLAALQRAQPDGPVILVGPCFGGAVALEMAARLERMGRRPALLVMVNCFNSNWHDEPTRQSRVGIRARHLLERIRFRAGALRRLGTRERLEYVRERGALGLDTSGEQARYLVFRLATWSGLPRPAAVLKIDYANLYAQAVYAPRAPYSGQVLMVRAATPIARVYPLPSMGWSRVLRGAVEMLDLPCEQLEFWEREEILRQVAQRVDALVCSAAVRVEDY